MRILYVWPKNVHNYPQKCPQALLARLQDFPCLPDIIGKVAKKDDKEKEEINLVKKNQTQFIKIKKNSNVTNVHL